MNEFARRFPCRLGIVLLATAAALVAQAYVLIPVSFEELARRAEYVVVGRVTGQQARYNAERTMILTHTTVTVEEGIVGDPPSTLEIADYGGRVGDVVLTFSGQVPYRVGETILVFLCPDSRNRLRTCGAHQGRLEVLETSEGTREARGVMAGKEIRGTFEELRTRIRTAREVSR